MPFFIFGLRSRANVMGAQVLDCAHCGTQQLHQVVRIRRFFTLFFIPLIPFPSTYRAVCTVCKTRRRLRGADVAILPPPAPVTCPTCGTTSTDLDGFCRRCGTSLTQPAAPKAASGELSTPTEPPEEPRA